MTGKLSPKMKMFCEEYLIDLNGAQAAIRAGYSKHTAKEIASQNLTKPAVMKYLQSRINKRSERTQVTADYVLNGIKDVVERCVQATPVIEDGKPTGEYTFEANPALKGYELLGKHLKLFTEKQEIEVSGKIALEKILSDLDGQSTDLPKFKK